MLAEHFQCGFGRVPRAYIFFHNDGAIYPTLPLLIEAGVDIMNP